MPLFLRYLEKTQKGGGGYPPPVGARIKVKEVSYHGVSKVEIAGAPRGVPAARRHREIHAFCRLFAPYESLDLIRA